MLRSIRSRVYSALAVGLALLLSYPAFAVTFNNVPTLPLAPRLFTVSLTSSNGTTPQTLASCGTNSGQATKIQSISVQNTDTNAYTLVLSVNRSSGPVPIVDVSVPANSGAATSTVPVNVLGPSATVIAGLPTDAYGQYILCQLNDSVQVDVTSAITANKDVNVVAMGGDF